jgi:hypothetical protein
MKSKAAESGISGCELIYLRMRLPARYATGAGSANVQLNVALAQIDNKTGTDLNQRLCRVVYALETEDDSADAELEHLNHLLGEAK